MLKFSNVSGAVLMKLTKVMIVEDDMLLSIVEERMVGSLGFDVVGKAMSGEETIDNINDINPEILIVDIQLSGSLNGIDTIKQLREMNYHQPVVFLSGNSDTSLIEEARKLDCVDYLIKPITAASLLKPLEKAANYKNEKSPFAA